MDNQDKNKQNKEGHQENSPKNVDPNKPMGNVENSPNRNALNKDATKVQNPNRNLAQGGNNTPNDK